MPLTPGQILNNRYRIVKLLGQGGFGAVYRAWDLNLDSPRAIKENLDTSLQAQRQFKREAQILDKLVHPNLPRVIDHFIIPNQGQYLVMDFVEGQDLGEMLRNGPLPEARVLPWIIQVCDALSYLHDQNPPVIHRDVKPGNIKITPQGKAMLVDFGISKVYDPNLSTTVGARAVTPGYSPPEQYGKGVTDVRSDLYALGATLYHLLTGQLPPDSVDILTHVAPPPPTAFDLNANISDRISSAVAKAMALDREARWANAQEFKQAITTKPSMGGSKEGAVIPPTQIVTPSPSERPATSPFGMRTTGRKVSWGWLGAVGFLGLVVLILAALLIGSILSDGKEIPTADSTTEVVVLLPSQTTAPGRAAPQETLSATTEAPIIDSTPDLDFTDPHGIQMRLIPAGEFQMGSESGESDESPVHTVYLDAFYMDVYEATNAFYALCVEAGACTAPHSEGSSTRSSYYGDSTYDENPVINVDWNQAQNFCEWRSARLPSEAEWEKAARGRLEGKLYPWGDQEPECSWVNFSGCEGDTVKVGSYPANGYGLFDMAGNVWEWVMDWYSSDYYNSSISQNPPGPDSGDHRVLRGGDWDSVAYGLRVAYRSDLYPVYGPHDNVGFRCSRSPGW